MKIIFNALTGEFDYIKNDNFSYNIIPTNNTVTILLNQQMVVDDEIDIVGDLIIDGELAVI